MNEKKTNNFIGIAGFIAGLISVFLSIYGDFRKNNPCLFTILLLFFLYTIIVVVKFYFYNRKQEDYEKLDDTEAINKRIKHYTNDANYPKITLIGTFEDKIISEIYNSSKANSNNKSQSVTLISTNYGDTDPNLLNKIFDSEAQMRDKDFSHKFYGFHQYINIFKATNKDDNKNILILFWKKTQNDLIGIEIRNSSFNININDFLDYSFSVNISDGQKDEIENTITDILKLWKPLKNGFFKPIFPPTDNEKIKEEWRKTILKNFNDFALKLIKSNDYEEMKITWNLTKQSLLDYNIFKDWIKNQIAIAGKASTDKDLNFKVTRFLLIDSHIYKSDVEYKKIVNKISLNLLALIKSNNASGNYKLQYVDSHNLNQNLKNDFAILLGNEKIIQSSDTISTPGVLKVYFSKNKNAVEKIETKFNNLELRKKIIFSSLKEFEKSYNI